MSSRPAAGCDRLMGIQLAALASGRWWLALAVLPIQALFYPLGCALAVVTLGLSHYATDDNIRTLEAFLDEV